MESTDLEKLKYPIGHYNNPPEAISEEDIKGYISDIEDLSVNLNRLVEKFSEEQFNTVYRPGGWTVRQVIHHIGDSHLNALTRFKLALTEDMPTIKPYYEDKWAELGDYKNTPIEVSLDLIKAVHIRLVNLLRSMTKKDFEKSYFHPEHGKEFSLYEAAGMYSWHGKHHYAHIDELRKRMNW
ncbi:MAG: YfiT family bacillithiol transferase [Ignavibacteria bacterium]